MKSQVKSLLTGLLGLCLATSVTAQTNTPEISAAEKASLESQILALKSEKGAEADALRESLPVPLFAIDLNQELKDRKVSRTGAGVSRIVVDDENPSKSTRRAHPRGNVAPELLGERAPEPAEEALPETTFGPETIFGADDRYIFNDHRYPYNTVGRVSNSNGSCSGTLVGPRHLLTASHCIVWNGDGTVGWLKFEASSYDNFNLGVAWATRVYHYRKVAGPTLSAQDTAFDFVAVVLDRRLGDSLGWMGSRTYSPSWNGGAYWANIGYPFDLGGTTKPVFQRAAP